MQPTAITAQDPAANSSLDYRYSYSPSGQILQKDTEHGSYDYGYDSLTRLISVVAPDGEEEFAYDFSGNKIHSHNLQDWVYNANC